MLINKTIYTKIYIHVKYLEKKISFDYSSILYNQKKSQFTKDNTCDQNKKCKVSV